MLHFYMWEMILLSLTYDESQHFILNEYMLYVIAFVFHNLHEALNITIGFIL